MGAKKTLKTQFSSYGQNRNATFPHGKKEKWEVCKALQRFISSLQPFSSFLWQL
jgi:hypothetical protein